MFTSFLIVVYFDIIVAFDCLRGGDTTIERANGTGKAPAPSFY